MKVLRFFSIIFIFLLLIQSVFPLGKKDKSTDNSENEPAKEEKLPSESITLDLLLDTKKQNPKNHFNWKTSSNSSKTSNSSSTTKTESFSATQTNGLFGILSRIIIRCYSASVFSSGSLKQERRGYSMNTESGI